MQKLFAALWVLVLASIAPGCGPPGEKLLPVSGRVSVDGKPWTIGDVGFFPDSTKGNPNQKAAVGKIAADGAYEVMTSGQPGAAPGWYKVVVWATNDPAAAGNPWGPDGKLRSIKWLIDRRYTSQDTTPLTVEVVERPAPGQYDLRLTR